ncbi:internal scaffolding protein [Microviridae sp.]|nr:internal scaffolding protein [Microviridae sp.]
MNTKGKKLTNAVDIPIGKPHLTRAHAHRKVSFETSGVSLTEQSHVPSCDIRIIMKQAQKTGMVSHLAKHGGSYLDLASMPEFMEAQRILAEARSTFETIPSKIREQFHNDPAEFLEFIQNEENRTTMLEMGFTDAHLPPMAEITEPEAKPAEKEAAPKKGTEDE